MADVAGMEVLVAVPLELIFECRPKQEVMRRGLSIVLSLMQEAGFGIVRRFAWPTAV